jgi:Lar family restriction alleviation protein
MNDTTMNTGAASLLPCPFCGAAPKLIVGYSPLNHAFVECDCGMQTALKDTGEEVTAMWNRRSPTTQADAAPIINGHAINDLFLKWSEWTTELGEAISRKNIDGFVSELRAAIAAGGAQEPVKQSDARFVVIGYGETDHPQAAFINEREQLLDAVLGMMYTHASDADSEIRGAYAKDLADDDEWSSDGIWSTEFEIGGITIYDLGYGSAASNGEQK